ncbi:hypothetical protein LCGC14_2109830, partial [marine sediment metagenome]
MVSPIALPRRWRLGKPQAGNAWDILASGEVWVRGLGNTGISSSGQILDAQRGGRNRDFIENLFRQAYQEELAGLATWEPQYQGIGEDRRVSGYQLTGGLQAPGFMPQGPTSITVPQPKAPIPAQPTPKWDPRAEKRPYIKGAVRNYAEWTKSLEPKAKQGRSDASLVRMFNIQLYGDTEKTYREDDAFTDAWAKRHGFDWEEFQAEKEYLKPPSEGGLIWMPPTPIGQAQGIPRDPRWFKDLPAEVDIWAALGYYPGGQAPPNYEYIPPSMAKISELTGIVNPTILLSIQARVTPVRPGPGTPEGEAFEQSAARGLKIREQMQQMQQEVQEVRREIELEMQQRWQEAEATLKAVFPEERDAQAVFDWAAENPVRFFENLQDIGHTPETEALVTLLVPEATDELVAWLLMDEDSRRIYLEGIVAAGRGPDTDSRLRTLGFDEEEIEKLYYFSPEPEPEWKQAMFRVLGLQTGVGEDIARSLTAGWGDFLMTTGGMLSWLGEEGIGDKIAEFGYEGRKVAPYDNLGSFTWQHIFNPTFYTHRFARQIPTTMALMVPMLLTGGAASVLTVGMSTFARTVLIGVASVGGGMGSRLFESGMEAGGAFKAAVQKGLSVEEAKQVGNQVFGGNMRLAGWDIAQMGLM